MTVIEASTWRVVAAWLAAAALAAAAGCAGASDGLGHVAVEGTVSLDGRPLEAGTIAFAPLGAGAGATGEVRDGAFAIPEADGPSPGPCRVEVRSPRPTGRQVPDADDPARKVDEIADAVPERYNLRSELKADVSPNGPNRFTFELSGARPSARKGR